MEYLFVLAAYVISFGALGSVLVLAFIVWLKGRTRNQLQTWLFIAYLTLLFFLAGLQFALTNFAGWKGGVLVFGILEHVVLASLIYFLPASINFLLGRQWTIPRIIRVAISAVVYLGAGIADLFVISSPLPSLLAVLSFFLIILFVMANAARELPLIPDDATRMALFLLYGSTFIYLPLAQFIHLVMTGYEHILFISSILYHFIFSLCAIVYFYRSLGISSISNDNVELREACENAGLTKREVEVALLIALGFTYKEIAARLDLSPNTVGNHIATIYRKTGTRSKVEMVNRLREGP